jgi:hypothetical protein
MKMFPIYFFGHPISHVAQDYVIMVLGTGNFHCSYLLQRLPSFLLGRGMSYAQLQNVKIYDYTGISKERVSSSGDLEDANLVILLSNHRYRSVYQEVVRIGHWLSEIRVINPQATIARGPDDPMPDPSTFRIQVLREGAKPDDFVVQDDDSDDENDNPSCEAEEEPPRKRLRKRTFADGPAE